MAKSVRASVSKRNRANLRKKVFGPVDNARTERLAAKLQELASQTRPKGPERPDMDITADGTEKQIKAVKTAQSGEEMDIDAHTTKSTTSHSRKSGRVQKRNRRTRSSIVFQPGSTKAKKGSKKK